MDLRADSAGSSYIPNVPIRIGGIVVGRAVLYANGRIEVYIGSNVRGRQVFELFRDGMARDLSIVPSLIPATPVEFPT